MFVRCPCQWYLLQIPHEVDLANGRRVWLRARGAYITPRVHVVVSNSTTVSTGGVEQSLDMRYSTDLSARYYVL